ncbi:helix-turn-helix domain-containing protein [Fructobacillus tropaeoli]|uniref:helix-turn-helix domain-containing protein n=1 Tax=Fructobacillus tropaeoli TaxID=709323 RepID=UPI001455FEDD|nr:helix-turn-helix transcriptional regulator [Fructobacillus tropaeoli]NLS38598.1 helix-turn-helix domain-containing protein [Fructobacillus tropaeoli]
MTIDFFGDKLKSARRAKGLTQAELASRLNLSKGTISAYEQGLSYPSIETLAKICTYLDTSSDYLLGISDKFSVQFAGLSTKQMETILNFVSLVEQSNEILNEYQHKDLSN